jgi:predicted PurR-regulated permease PerM
LLDRLSKKKRNIALLVVLALIGWFFWTIRSVLNPLILGYLLAFVLHPAVLHLERRRGWTRRRAVNVIFLAAALFIGTTLGGIYLQGRQLVESVTTAADGEDVLQRAEARVDAFLARVREFADRWLPNDDEPAEGDGGESGEADDTTGEAGGPAPETSAEHAAGAPDTSSGPPETAEAAPAPASPLEQASAPAAGHPSGGATLPVRRTAPQEVSSARGAAKRPGAAATPPGPEETSTFTLRDLVRRWWEATLARTEGDASTVAVARVPAFVVVAGNVFGSVLSFVTLLLLLPIYGYFLLFELERIHRFVRRHVPKDERERVTRIGTQIGEVIANFFRGRLLICVLKGSVIAFGLAVAGAPYPLFFGVLAGVLSLVPFVGPMSAFLVAAVFALQELAFVDAMLWVGGTFLLGEILEGYVFIPKILGDSLGLHPVVVLVSVFAGGAALGMFGLLIAIPLTAALVILARELLLPALRQFADEDSHSDLPRDAASSLTPAVAAAASGAVGGAGPGGPPAPVGHAAGLAAGLAAGPEGGPAADGPRGAGGEGPTNDRRRGRGPRGRR